MFSEELPVPDTLRSPRTVFRVLRHLRSGQTAIHLLFPLSVQ